MNGIFYIDVENDDGTCESRVADNLMLDQGMEFMAGSNQYGLFADGSLFIGSSNKPTDVTNNGDAGRGVLKYVAGKGSTITTPTIDDLAPYVFFTASAEFGEGEGLGKWAEISYRGFNRALLKSLGKLTGGTHAYRMTCYNQFGESQLSVEREVVLSSPATASNIVSKTGLINLPHKFILDGKTPISGRFELRIRPMNFYAGTWTNQAEINEWGIPLRPLGPTFTFLKAGIADDRYMLSNLVSGPLEEFIPTENAYRAHVNFTLDGQLFNNYECRVTIEGPFTEPDQFGNPVTFSRTMYHIPITPKGEGGPFFKLHIEDKEFVGGTLMIDVTHQAQYRLQAKETDLSIVLDTGWQPFLTFWDSTSSGGAYKGEPIDTPYFTLLVWEGAIEPIRESVSEFFITRENESCGAYITWEHPTTFSGGGIPTGYRLYRRKPDNSYGLIADIPVTYTLVNGVYVPNGDTHFWDGGFVDPGVSPNITGNGPGAITAATFLVEPKHGLIPRPFIKTDAMRCRVHTQIFFYDANSALVGSVEVTPSSATIYAGDSIDFDAAPKNDYGEVMTGKTASWSVIGTGTLNVDPDTLGATYTNTIAGNHAVQATVESVIGSAFVTVLPGPAVSLTFETPEAIGAGANAIEASWDAGQSTLTITYPHAGTAASGSPAPEASASFLSGSTDITPNVSVRTDVLGDDQYGNDKANFPVNWEMDGVSQRPLNPNGTYGTPSAVDGAVVKLTTNNTFELKAPGTAIMKVREILPDGTPSAVTKTFTLEFNWR